MSWSEVKKINSDFTKPLDTLIVGEYGKKTDAAASTAASTLFSWIKAIYAAVTTSGKTSVIKSIQRGTTGWVAGTHTKNISISTVDPTKCVVLLDGGVNIAEYPVIPYVAAVYSTYFTITVTAGHPANIGTTSWQLVEFY